MNDLKTQIADRLFSNGVYDRRKIKANADLISSLEQQFGSCATKTELVYKVFYGADANKCVCGKPTRFISWTKGYAGYCSDACAKRSNEVKRKRVESIKKTVQERYGVDNVLRLPDVRHKIAETTKSRYGVDNYTKSDAFKQKVRLTAERKYQQDHHLKDNKIREKIRATMLQKYGGETTLQSKILRAKVINTMLQRYGSATTWQSPSLIHKLHDWQKSRYENKVRSFAAIESIDDDIINVTHECGAKIQLKYFSPIKCPSCKISSIPEQEVFEFVNSIVNDAVRNDRKIIAPKEIDIFIPSYNLGLEINGAYWHHDKTEKTSLLQKSQLAAEKGITLLHFWDYEWINKRNIVENLIKAALGKFDKRIAARKTEVKTIPSKLSINFLDEHHLHGAAKAKHHFGLFYENELVAVLLLNKPRFNNTADLEVVRLCYKPGIQIIGGLSKLLEFSRKQLKYTSLFSYVDLRISTGKGFEAAGFTEIGHTLPGYVWFHKKVGEVKRHLTMKHRLHRLLEEPNLQLTEDENMRLAGFLKLFDCGNKKLLLRINN